MLFARWIDLGAPIDYAHSSYGWFLDDLRPTLTLSLPPGQYALICNIPGHYMAGMHAALTVSA